MTISQPSSNPGSGCAPAPLRPLSAASFGRLVYLALVRWRARRRAKADLARLTEAGDHLLQDVGLDPNLARQNPAALLERILGER